MDAKGAERENVVAWFAVPVGGGNKENQEGLSPSFFVAAFPV